MKCKHICHIKRRSEKHINLIPYIKAAIIVNEDFIKKYICSNTCSYEYVIANLKEPLTVGSVVASDAFFPFPDGLIAAADAGVTAVIQPGGSIKDQEVIDAANDRGLVMVFTSIRHFKH